MISLKHFLGVREEIIRLVGHVFRWCLRTERDGLNNIKFAGAAQILCLHVLRLWLFVIINDISWIQLSNFVRLQHLHNFFVLVEREFLEEGLDGGSSGLMQYLLAARMLFDILSDVIDAIAAHDPELIVLFCLLMHLFASVYGPLARLLCAFDLLLHFGFLFFFQCCQTNFGTVSGCRLSLGLSQHHLFS